MTLSMEAKYIQILTHKLLDLIFLTALIKKVEWKWEELSEKNMGKGLQKVFKYAVNLKNSLPTSVEAGLEVSHFIPEASNFSGVNK